jgi:hypothetical protein
MIVNLAALYGILRRIATTHDTLTYTDLTVAYRLDPQGKATISPRLWGVPLGHVSRWADSQDLPAISAVIYNHSLSMPGEGFWGIGTAPQTPDQTEWKKYLQEVYAANWPQKYSGPPTCTL